MTRSRGFTLIELLIVIVIIGLTLGISISNFRDFGRRQEVDNFARILIGDLRSAQADAASGRRMDTCTGSFTGYRVSFTATSLPGNAASATSYSILSVCNTAPNAANTVLIKTVTLPPNLFIHINRSPTAGVVNLLFKPLQLGTDVPANNDLTLTVSHGMNQRTTVVTVSTSGEVK